MLEQEMSDHDLLIKLASQTDYIKQRIDQMTPVIDGLDKRLAEIEGQSARHSERLTALRGDVDALKLDKLNKAEIQSLQADVDELQKKSDAWNFINSMAIGVATVIGFIFRK